MELSICVSVKQGCCYGLVRILTSFRDGCECMCYTCGGIWYVRGP